MLVSSEKLVMQVIDLTIPANLHGGLTGSRFQFLRG